MFICFEGIDGSGKSTHMQYFTQQLKKYTDNIIITREVGGTFVGEKLRELFLHQELNVTSQIALAFTARQMHIEQVINPALSQNKIVISDRFIDSTYAYQGYGAHGDFNLISQLHTILCNNLYPDLTLLFDIDPMLANQRINTRHLHLQKFQIPKELDVFEKSTLEFHQKVRNGYLEVVQKNLNNNRTYKIIDASQSIEKIQAILDEILLDITSKILK